MLLAVRSDPIISFSLAHSVLYIPTRGAPTDFSDRSNPHTYPQQNIRDNNRSTIMQHRPSRLGKTGILLSLSTTLVENTEVLVLRVPCHDIVHYLSLSNLAVVILTT